MRILLFILISGICLNAYGQTSIDGKTYSIKLKVSGPERPGIEWTKDELAFNDGSFTSKFMGEREKFPPFIYKVADYIKINGYFRFTAEGENPGGSTIVWEANIKGDEIEGTAVWTNSNGPQKQTFKGSLVKKK